jgi:hypothetical protein
MSRAFIVLMVVVAVFMHASYQPASHAAKPSRDPVKPTTPPVRLLAADRRIPASLFTSRCLVPDCDGMGWF